MNERSAATHPRIERRFSQDVCWRQDGDVSERRRIAEMVRASALIKVAEFRTSLRRMIRMASTTF